MSSRLLNDLEIDPGLSQPAAESMAEIVPAKVRDLRVFDRFVPPSPVLPDVEDPFAGRHFAEVVHGGESVIVQMDRSWRSILGVVRHEPLDLETPLNFLESCPIYHGLYDEQLLLA